jgi:hypothetical protein
MTGWSPQAEAHWVTDCQHWRRKVLTGKFRHWCWEWDGLPVDETCPEWPCGCFDEKEMAK